MKRLFLFSILLAGVIVTVSACDKNDDYNPSLITESLKSFINTSYNDARIVGADYERGFLKIEIIHEKKEKDLYFENGQWQYTEWDVRATDLPAAVTAAIAGTEYASYRIDDADYIQKSSGDYYLIELEQGNHEVRLSITPQGVLL